MNMFPNVPGFFFCRRSHQYFQILHFWILHFSVDNPKNMYNCLYFLQTITKYFQMLHFFCRGSQKNIQILQTIPECRSWSWASPQHSTPLACSLHYGEHRYNPELLELVISFGVLFFHRCSPAVFTTASIGIILSWNNIIKIGNIFWCLIFSPMLACSLHYGKHRYNPFYSILD